MPTQKTIGVLVFPGACLLDLAGPLEVFAEANRTDIRYDVSMLSVDGADVTASMGMRIPVDRSAFESRSFDAVLVAGGEIFPASAVSGDLAEAARFLSRRTAHLAAICTGAFILGAAGLLDGLSATTHPDHVAELARRYPTVSVDSDSSYVRSGQVYTSGCFTAAIDLALALFAEDHGEAAAREIARSLIVFQQRRVHRAPPSELLAGVVPRSAELRRLTQQINDDPVGPHALSDLALRANLSTRQLTRLFRAELDVTPQKYVESVRFSVARALLQSGHSVAFSAANAGFGSAEALRRSFVTHTGVSPTEFLRQHRRGTAS
ncbi:GlxA family transcriptional regulator [Microbacterium sp. NPDC058062]|uniref:GlxA family transcriptional regulator n=1 Tax=Microbacterium sp. NPDC058062 TaxID=3346320 RepID=UPI0036D804C4